VKLTLFGLGGDENDFRPHPENIKRAAAEPTTCGCGAGTCGSDKKEEVTAKL
jgi:hypothetical protein